ncbi:MAG: dipicolinate synthase subunit DpsA [Acutalibacteraceae bacterium]
MVEMNRFGILGGDKRQIYLAQSIAADGYQVYACGFDEDVEMKRVVKVSFDELTDTCGLIILPLPVTQDGKYLNMSFSKEKLLLDDTFAEKMVDKQVFGGALNRLKATSTLWNKIAMYDYSVREEFAVQNAVPTAEGAIMIVMELSEGTINGSNCLVTGYGVLAKYYEMLKGLGQMSLMKTGRFSLDSIKWLSSGTNLN